jgi:Hyaluronan / mRNA binding family
MKSPARSPAAPGQCLNRGRPFDRHSATGSRGLPKKNGAGGKGVWGAAEEQSGVPAALDKNDPNYDSDEDEAFEAPPALELAVPAKAEVAQAVKDEAGSAPSSAR